MLKWFWIGWIAGCIEVAPELPGGGADLRFGADGAERDVTFVPSDGSGGPDAALLVDAVPFLDAAISPDGSVSPDAARPVDAQAEEVRDEGVRPPLRDAQSALAAWPEEGAPVPGCDAVPAMEANDPLICGPARASEAELLVQPAPERCPFRPLLDRVASLCLTQIPGDIRGCRPLRLPLPELPPLEGGIEAYEQVGQLEEGSIELRRRPEAPPGSPTQVRLTFDPEGRVVEVLLDAESWFTEAHTVWAWIEGEPVLLFWSYQTEPRFRYQRHMTGDQTTSESLLDNSLFPVTISYGHEADGSWSETIHEPDDLSHGWRCDAQARLTLEWESWRGVDFRERTYDACGRLVQAEACSYHSPTGMGRCQEPWTAWQYDAAGRVATIWQAEPRNPWESPTTGYLIRAIRRGEDGRMNALDTYQCHLPNEWDERPLEALCLPGERPAPRLRTCDMWALSPASCQAPGARLSPNARPLSRACVGQDCDAVCPEVP